MGIQKRYGYVLSGYTEYIGQYLILINGVLKVYSLVLPSGEVCISKYTPLGVYRLLANEILYHSLATLTEVTFVDFYNAQMSAP